MQSLHHDSFQARQRAKKLQTQVINEETQNADHEIIKKYALTNVTIEDGFLSLEQYIDRMLSFDCFINLSKGEGFSFIPREALALGLSVMITNNTASKTICQSGCAGAVKSQNKVPPPYLYKALFNDECGKQFGCQIQDVTAALRDVYEHYDALLHQGR